MLVESVTKAVFIPLYSYFRVLTNSKFGLIYSNFLILTSFFSKVPMEKYGKTPNFSGRQHFYSYFQNPSENSDTLYYDCSHIDHLHPIFCAHLIYLFLNVALKHSYVYILCVELRHCFAYTTYSKLHCVMRVKYVAFTDVIPVYLNFAY